MWKNNLFYTGVLLALSGVFGGCHSITGNDYEFLGRTDSGRETDTPLNTDSDSSTIATQETDTHSATDDTSITDTGTTVDTSGSDTNSDGSTDSATNPDTDTATDSVTDTATDSVTDTATSTDTASDVDTASDSASDSEVQNMCVDAADFTPCEQVTVPDRSYDICIDGQCQSPGCGTLECNVPGISFTLADSNQRTCFDADGTIACPALDAAESDGQDAQFGWDVGNESNLRFTTDTSTASQPVVQDEVTGLGWQGCPAGVTGNACETDAAESYLWADALVYCDNLDWGGYTDWRLPSEFELLSIVDFGVGAADTATVDGVAFPSTGVASYFTSTTSNAAETYALIVRFDSGDVTGADKKTAYRVRCVRSQTEPVAMRFIRSVHTAEPVVVDNTTQLVWQGCLAGTSGEECKTGAPTSLYWQSALRYCTDSTWAGFTDWRLPNITELQSITNSRTTSHALSDFPFEMAPTRVLSSSTTSAGEPSYYWAVNATDGGVQDYTKAYTYSNVICVRDGAPWTMADIPHGEFWMGSPNAACPSDYPNPGGSCANEIGRNEDEVLHYVSLTTDFEMMATEITQEQFGVVTQWYPGASCGNMCAVGSVGWYDMLAFANALSEGTDLPPCYLLSDIVCTDTTAVGDDYMACLNSDRGGIDAAVVALNGVDNPYACRGFRLPTEAEWEYAVRAHSLTPIYPSASQPGTITTLGASDENLDFIAVYYYHDSTRNAPSLVGRWEPNDFELYDMIGNVWEWVWDGYSAYPVSGTANPDIDPLGDDASAVRVFRGGAYDTGPDICRSAWRHYGSLNRHNKNTGGRLVRSLFK